MQRADELCRQHAAGDGASGSDCSTAAAGRRSRPARPDDPAGAVGRRRGASVAASSTRTRSRKPNGRPTRPSPRRGSTLFGTAVAPDATFTLRLAFGVVKGYDVDGKTIPFHTTFGGAFERADKQGNREPFDLPRRWLDGKGKLDLKTPFNFVSTADTIGGNSGSPVLNRAGELVGINFDRNRHGLVRNFVYTDVQARHISVHCRSVIEALRKLYDAGALVQELTAK